MIRLRRPRRRATESVVPMINVAFLLLIFFLMVAVIAPPDPVAVALPDAATDQELRPDAELIWTIAADGSVFTAGGGSADTAGIAGRTVVLRADASVPATRVAQVLKDLSLARVGSVQLAVRPR